MGQLTDEKIDAALERGKPAHATEPRAVSATYDRRAGCFVITLKSGTEVKIPAHLLQSMKGTSVADRSNVRVEGAGYGLHWPTLDLDFSVPGLLADVFGTKSYMAKKAGQVTSRAKAVAARKNGRNGGRPRGIKAA